MLSVDTNILVHALNRRAPEHEEARAFLAGLADERDVAICELVLLEVYVLLRNPAVFSSPCSPAEAVDRIQGYRRHPKWQLVDYPGEEADVMARLWEAAARPGASRRRVFDVRLALTLRHHGVTHLATANTKDFDGFGFTKVWDPLSRGA